MSPSLSCECRENLLLENPETLLDLRHEVNLAVGKNLSNS